jgi:hypothetical protein
MSADPTSLAGKRFPTRAEHCHVVIGAGEAGCAAALAAPQGTLLVDEHPLDPVLIGLDIPYLFGGRVGASAQIPARIEERVVAARPGLLDVLEAGVEVALGTCVWGVFGDGPWLLGLADRETAWLVRAETITLATGAQDVPIPLPGWTLPGVMGARGLDAAQRLIGDFTGRRIVALGAGEVHHPDVALRVPQAPGALRILGTDAVEGIAWQDGETWREFACDTVVMAVDAAPNMELPELLGCRIGWAAAHGGFVATETPRGVALTGDVAGTGAVARGPWMALALADDAARVCACEEVTAGDLRALHPPRHLGAAGPPGGLGALGPAPPQDQVKRLTRAGMGPCQGRRCRASVHALLGYPPRLASHRPPLRPLPLAVLAALEEDPAMRAHWTNWFGIAAQWLPHDRPAPEEAGFIGGRLSAGAGK